MMFKLRCRMTNVKHNFKNMYEDQQCQLCLTEEERQPHLFQCEVLIDTCEELAENIDVEFEDLFSTKDKQETFIKLFCKVWQMRAHLLE